MPEAIRRSPLDEGTVPASLIATGPSTPEGTSGLNEKAGPRIEVTRIAIDQGSVMRVDGSHILLYPTRVEPVVVRNEQLWRNRAGPARSVQRSQHEPPGGKPVSATVGRTDKAVVGAATDTIGKPLSERGLVRWRPAAVLIEPLMGATDGLSEGQHISAS